MVTNFKRNLIASRAVINEPINPTISKETSCEEKLKSLFIKSRAVAPAMVGIASRNENSTAAILFNPKNIPPIMVAPALETPGIIEIDWQTPIKKACLLLILLISET